MLDLNVYTEEVRYDFRQANRNLAAQNRIIEGLCRTRERYPVVATTADGKDSDWVRLLLFEASLYLGSRQPLKADELIAERIRDGGLLVDNSRAYDLWARAKQAMHKPDEVYARLVPLIVEGGKFPHDPFLSITAAKAGTSIQKYAEARVIIEPHVQPGQRLAKHGPAQELYSQILIALDDYDCHISHFGRHLAPLSRNVKSCARTVAFRQKIDRKMFIHFNQAQALYRRGHYEKAEKILAPCIQKGARRYLEVDAQLLYGHIAVGARLNEKGAAHMLRLIDKTGPFHGNQLLTNLCAKSLLRAGWNEAAVFVLGPWADTEQVDPVSIKGHHRYVDAHVGIVREQAEKMGPDALLHLQALADYLKVLADRAPQLAENIAHLSVTASVNFLIRERTAALSPSGAGRSARSVQGKTL